MTERRKIIALKPANVLAAAQTCTGEGVSETLLPALEKPAHQDFYDRLKALKGKVKFDDFDLDELRRDREFDERGYVVPA